MIESTERNWMPFAPGYCPKCKTYLEYVGYGSADKLFEWFCRHCNMKVKTQIIDAKSAGKE